MLVKAPNGELGNFIPCRCDYVRFFTFLPRRAAGPGERSGTGSGGAPAISDDITYQLRNLYKYARKTGVV